MRPGQGLRASVAFGAFQACLESKNSGIPFTDTARRTKEARVVVSFMLIGLGWRVERGNLSSSQVEDDEKARITRGFYTIFAQG